MTKEEYYESLKEKHGKTDLNNLEEVKQYNEFARLLRSLMEWEEK